MSFAYQSVARAYANVGLETEVSTVDPAHLIVMLYEGALLSIARAGHHMQNRDVQRKGEAVSKAIQIIDEGLKASLEIQRGGDLARQLWQLYEYMCRRLLLASVNNEQDGFDEVTRLLSDLKEAWSSLGRHAAAGMSVGNIVQMTTRTELR
jgi:flagellar protein FliS